MSAPAATPVRPARRLRGWLHRSYLAGTGINHFLRRRLRPAGIALMLAGLLLACLAGGQAADPVFRLFSFVFALGALSLLALPLRRARLEVRRELPAHATAGEPVRLHYQLRNLRGRPLANARLVETPPDPRPRRAQFLTAREPGEESRNWFDRVFAYYCWTWLCERGQRFEARPSSQRIDVAGHGRQALTAELLPARRGLVKLDDLRLLLPDPLGFFQRCARVRAPVSTLAVLPRRYRLPEFELPGGARFQPGGDAASRHAGASGEFVGLRDYQPGDPLRLIHWKSWARTGKPIVKEFEETFFPRHGLILDTFPDDDELFEEAVSVAASFASSIDSRESLIELMFISGRDRVVSAGRGAGPSTTLLEVLAGVEASDTPAFDALERLVTRHAEDLAGCLAVLAGWSPERQKLLRKLAGAGIELAAIVVCHEPPEARPPRVHFVRHGQLAADLLKLPRTL